MPFIFVEDAFPRLSKIDDDTVIMNGINQHGSLAGPPRGQSDATY